MSLLLALLLCGQLPGTFTPDPRLDWHTLPTDRFRVHFAARGAPDPATEALARRIAGIAEAVADSFEQAGVPRPAGPVDVVVADVQDRPNGWASPLPRNTITLFPVLPSGDRVGFDDWLWTLFAHEYAHVEQLDRATGPTAALRRVFGRIILTAPLAPIWLLEGYAQLRETRLSSYGRLRSSEYEMLLRAAALQDRLLPADRCVTYELESWPGGLAPYLHGGMFSDWLNRLPARDSSAGDGWEAYNRVRGRLPPFTEQPASRRTWGRGFAALWREWQAAARAQAESARQAIARAPVTPLRWLTDEGWHAGSPCWSGGELLYLSRDRSEYPSIRALDTATGRTRVLHQAQVHGALSLSPDGRTLAFSRHDIGPDFHERSGLWLLDLATLAARPILPGRRLRDPGFSPDGRRLAAVLVRAGGDALVTIDLESGRLSLLLDPDEPTGFSSPRFSPSGRWLAFGINRPEGRPDIELLDLERGWRVPVTDDAANDLSPCWSRDGKRLYFISDRDGVFNLYAREVATGRTVRCTNVLTGVFEPAVALSDSLLALVGCSARGFDIALLPVRPKDWQPAAEPDPPRPATAPRWQPADGPVRAYSALPGLAPALWFPLALPAGGWQAGAFTFGWDPLHFHEYILAAGWRFSGTPFLALDYTLTRFRPRFRLSADLDLDRRDLALDVELPFPATRRSTRLAFGTGLVHDSLARTRFSLAAATSTALRFRGQPAPTEGAILGLESRLESRALAGARDRVRVAGYCVQFIEPWPDASLRLEAAAATAFGDRSADSAWAIAPGPGVLAVRGWPAASARCRTVTGLRAELRVTAWQPERGLGTLPLFLSRVSLAGFADGAAGWNGLLPGAQDPGRLGTGLEARAELVIGHLLPVTLTAGAATPVLPRPLGSHQLYLEVGSRFLTGLLSRPGDGVLVLEP